MLPVCQTGGFAGSHAQYDCRKNLQQTALQVDWRSDNGRHRQRSNLLGHCVGFRAQQKYSVDTQDNYAYAAVIDPVLASSMPVKLAVSSALDAVCHAAESYWAKASNTVSRAAALAAIKIIMENIDGLLCGKEEAHDAMAQGSMLAGLAFSNTRTTACHSISYPLTMKYHIPHGVAVSMLLAPVMSLNQPYIKNRKELFGAFGVENVSELSEKVTAILENPAARLN